MPRTRNTVTCTLAATLAAALAAVAGHALAQDRSALSPDEVRSFFDRAEQDAVRIAGSNDFAGFETWLRDYVSDDARFDISAMLEVAGEPKGAFTLWLDMDDIVPIVRTSIGTMSHPGMTIDDYALDIEVVEVVPLGPGAATARTAITETGTLAYAGKSDADAAAMSIRIEAKAQCDHVVSRDGSGNLRMGLSTCRMTLCVGPGANAAEATTAC